MRFVIATPARWSAVGEELEIRDDVSESSDWSSRSRSASWVVAKAGMSIASLGDMVCVFLSGCDGGDHVSVVS